MLLLKSFHYQQYDKVHAMFYSNTGQTNTTVILKKNLNSLLRQGIIDTIGCINLNNVQLLHELYGGHVFNTRSNDQHLKSLLNLVFDSMVNRRESAETTEDLNFVYSHWSLHSHIQTRVSDGFDLTWEKSIHEIIQDPSFAKTDNDEHIVFLKPMCRIVFDIDTHHNSKESDDIDYLFEKYRFCIMLAVSVVLSEFLNSHHPNAKTELESLHRSIQSYAWKSSGREGGYRLSVCGKFIFFYRKQLFDFGNFINKLVLAATRSTKEMNVFTIDTGVYQNGRSLRVPFSHKCDFTKREFTRQLLPVKNNEQCELSRGLLHAKPHNYDFKDQFNRLCNRCINRPAYDHWLSHDYSNINTLLVCIDKFKMLTSEALHVELGTTQPTTTTTASRLIFEHHFASQTSDSVLNLLKVAFPTQQQSIRLVSQKPKNNTFSWRTNACYVHQKVHGVKRLGTILTYDSSGNMRCICFKH